ncbi:MAG: sigma-70 family RNA polymerase sigma factor [Patescibacteria group bacterium]|nr:sigma-70 family RNA polymerase sigma factor [Patescibacteria group bacterium]
MNNNKFKYDIIHNTSIDTYEKLPKYFLADDPIEAEKLYAKFSNLLNNISYIYFVLSGIPKSDLFGEALLGLARANRDWNIKYNSNFKTYVVFRVKDTLNEYIRRNAQIVIIPSYVKKGSILLNKIKILLKKFEVSSDDIYKVITTNNVKNINIPNKQKIICKEMLKKLKAATIRAKVDYEKFIKRIECLPIDFIIDNQTESNFQNVENEKLNAAILVKNLKRYMNKNEIIICDYIMFGLTYKEIGTKFCKSDAWVAKQIKNLRKKLLTKLKKEDV